ncbi:hypothetical protein JZ751_014729 [Albula glossodonta]|uniref:Uncharacterized protein n=1 Tax=Albula glossodonta TaxID=121402 RepID=A0A8T2N2G7_9TELE|nr:hypothetical protein JZ751_014729 [Albula glossodonta]
MWPGVSAGASPPAVCAAGAAQWLSAHEGRHCPTNARPGVRLKSTEPSCRLWNTVQPPPAVSMSQAAYRGIVYYEDMSVLFIATSGSQLASRSEAAELETEILHPPAPGCSSHPPVRMSGAATRLSLQGGREQAGASGERSAPITRERNGSTHRDPRGYMACAMTLAPADTGVVLEEVREEGEKLEETGCILEY